MMASKTEAKESSLMGDTSMEKRRRKRHKKLMLDVCQQIEFYFSDANLRKDRFLKQEMAKSKGGYVSVETIANFNKLQSMSKDRKIVVSAIQQSPILELSEDQQYVKRREPLKPPKYDPDDCTVYVECLPKKADHDWLKKAFSYCGKVVYVSLPRYKSTSDIKGFAFIEFECPEEAERACELMNNPPPDMKDRAGKFPKMRGNKRIVPLEFDQSKGHISRNQTDQGRDTEENKGIYEDGRDTEQGSEKEKETDMRGPVDDDRRKRSRKRQLEEEEEEEEKTSDVRERKVVSKSDKNADKQPTDETESSKSSDAPKGLKRKRVEEAITESHKSKRKGMSSSESCDRDEEDGEEQKRKILREAKMKMKRKRSLSEGDMWSVRENDEDNDDDSNQGNKMIKKCKTEEMDDGKEDEGLERKKRNRKKKIKRFQEEEEVLFLRVISKREWLFLKEEYLTLQKESLAQMKEAQRMSYHMPVFRRGTHTQSQVSGSDQPKVTSEGNPPQSKINEPVFIKGTVMKLECLQPSVSRKDVKEHLQSISPVAYVDLPDGHTQGFVRFESAEGPKAVLEETNAANLASQHISLSLVTGVEEKAYWEKLSRDREIKLSSKQKKKKKRGVNKNVQKAGKGSMKEKAHIRFDE